MNDYKKKPILAIYRWRFYMLVSLIAAAVVLILWRLINLQVLDKQFLQGQGESRTLRTEVVSAHRGIMTDRNGEPLAVSTPVMSLWINPQQLKGENQSVLAKAVGISNQKLDDLLKRYQTKEFLYLKRHLIPEEAEKILALELPGVYSRKEYRRYYPSGEVAAHVVGRTNIDDIGQEGLELAYDQWLTGSPGKQQVLKDRRGKIIKEMNELKAAEPGKDLQLSIDLRIQHLAYKALKKQVSQYQADGGSMVILDINSGEVLAMVNQPSYNPNRRKHIELAHLRNRAVTDVFEPGSTVKPLTVIAALESGRYLPTSLIDTNPGYIRVGSKIRRDPRNYGVIDVTGVITKSSQVGAIKLALSMEPDVIREVFYRLGLGQATNSGFPGESNIPLPVHHQWRDNERVSFAFGYGFQVNALQLAQTYMIFASHGIKRQVSLLKLDKNIEQSGTRVISATVAENIMNMLATVVDKGTATRAKLDSYRVAGKTGTVRKVGTDGEYDDSRHMTFFAGIAPVDQPRFVCVVTVDEPKGDVQSGGGIAAPVFAKVMARVLQLYNVPPDIVISHRMI